MIDFEVRCDNIAEMKAVAETVSPKNIYDDVEELKSQVANIIAQVDDTAAEVNGMNGTLANMTEELAAKLGEDTEDISGYDLNNMVGSIIFGYGNNCLNRPTGAANGYFINTSHSSKPGYNKQFWFERPNNRAWTRFQEDEVWSEWVPFGGEHLRLNANVPTNRTFDGQTVYCKTVNIGNLPNTTTKAVESGLRPEEIFVIEIKGTADGSDSWLPIPNPHPTLENVISCYLRADGKIVVATGKDRSTMVGRVEIYYINK